MSPWQVFTTFLKLGLTAFGGPIAHLAYFQRTLVQEKRWLDDADYAQLVALCQILPSPTSSQVGMALGLCNKPAFVAQLPLGWVLPFPQSCYWLPSHMV